MSQPVAGRRSAALHSHEINPAPVAEENSVKAPKPVREKLVVHTDPDAPVRGLQAIQYGVKHNTRRVLGEIGVRYQPSPTIPGKAERRERAERRLEKLKQELYELVILKGQQRIIAVLNSKGGAGKTPVSANTACVISWASEGEELLLIDANENAGTTADRMNVPGTLTLKEVEAQIGRLNTNESMTRKLARHRRYNVRVISSDQSDTTELDDERVMRTIRTLKKNVSSVVIDSGNGIAHAANRGSAQLADALVFSALWEEHTLDGSVNASMKALASTMREYAKQNLEEKVRQAFIVVSKVKEARTELEAAHIKQQVWDTLEAHFNLIPLSDLDDGQDKVQKMSLSDYGFTMDRLILVPYSEHVAANKVVDLDADVIGIHTLIGYLELLVAIYRQKPVESTIALAQRLSQPVSASVGFGNFDIPSILPQEEIAEETQERVTSFPQQ